MLKRLAVLALVLMALTRSAFASECLCLVIPEMAALIDEQGEYVLEGEGIEDAFVVREGAIYAAGKKGDYRLYDSCGEPLGETRFSMIDDLGDRLIFRADGLYGAMDERGNVIIPAVWTQLTANDSGGYLALDSDPLDERADELVHIDSEGTENRTGVYTACGLSTVLSGRMPIMTGENRYGAVDGEGQVVVDTQWRYIGDFEGGVAIAVGDAGMGLIDVDGEEVLPAIYDLIERSPSMIVARSDTRVEVYAPDGAVRLFTIQGNDLDVEVVGEHLVAADAERVCLYDAAGALLAEEPAGTTYAQGTMGQVIAAQGVWGEACQWLIDADGSPASGLRQFIIPLCDGRYAFLEMKGVAYYSDLLARLQTSWDYDSARWGLMDASGREILPARFKEIRALGETRLLLLEEGVAHLSDIDGNVIKSWVTAETEAPSAEAGA